MQDSAFRFDPAWLEPPVPSDDVRPAYSDFDKLLTGMRQVNEIDRQIAQARMDMARDVAGIIAQSVHSEKE